MDTRYTMRLAAPLSDEEIPAFAERLADIIKGDPAKLASLLGRGTKSLIRATSREEAEKVATVFRRAGLDVEVVSREEAAAAVIASTAAPAADPAATSLEGSEPSSPMEAPAAAGSIAVEAMAAVESPLTAIEQASEPETEAPVEVGVAAEEHGSDDHAAGEVEDAAADDHVAEDAAADDPLAAETAHEDEVGGYPESAPAPESRADDRAADVGADSYRYDAPRFTTAPPPPSPTARLVGLIGALLLIVAPFLGTAAAGIEFDLADMGANPYALVLIVLGLVSLLPVLLGRIRWLLLAALLALALWVFALAGSGLMGEPGALLDRWAWLLFPVGGLLLLVAALLPRPR